MNIITTADLATTVQKELMQELYDAYNWSGSQETFDDWVWNNESIAGRVLYEYFGNLSGGNCEDARIDLGIE